MYITSHLSLLPLSSASTRNGNTFLNPAIRPFSSGLTSGRQVLRRSWCKKHARNTKLQFCRRQSWQHMASLSGRSTIVNRGQCPPCPLPTDGPTYPHDFFIDFLCTDFCNPLSFLPSSDKIAEEWNFCPCSPEKAHFYWSSPVLSCQTHSHLSVGTSGTWLETKYHRTTLKLKTSRANLSAPQTGPSFGEQIRWLSVGTFSLLQFIS